MKFESILTICGATLFMGVAVAAFIDDKSPISTVSEALKMRDDTPVILEGKITERLKKDMYRFQDSTGSVVVEIDRKDWQGIDVRPSDTVQIQGEVDKDWLETTIDVHSIKIVP